MSFQNPIVIKPILISVNRIKQKISFVNSTENPVDEKKSTIQPAIVIINANTLIAVLCCVSPSSLFHYVVEIIFLVIIHLALLSVVANYLILIPTKKFDRATNIILTTGMTVVISLFATWGSANKASPWKFDIRFLNNSSNH